MASSALFSHALVKKLSPSSAELGGSVRLSVLRHPRLTPYAIRCDVIPKVSSSSEITPEKKSSAKEILSAAVLTGFLSFSAVALPLSLPAPLTPPALAGKLADIAADVTADSDLVQYYGTAASASSYGGYGGNASKQATAEYVYLVPGAWKERNISKVEKGTNGTDSEFYNPKKRTEKTYVTFLAGFRRLPPQENVLNNLALSDVNLQDELVYSESVDFSERRVDGQLYYDYEIRGPMGHSLITVTCTKNKLYAHFVNAPTTADWDRDGPLLKQIHDSFATVGVDPFGSN